MDARSQEEITKQKVFEQENADEKDSNFVMEDGDPYRMPYKIVKQVTFKNLDQKELKDIPYSARLQYRLLLFDAVIKAKVD